MSKSPVKAVLLQAHSIVGLVIALFLTVIGLTGAIMSFEDEIQASLNADLTHVAARAEPTLAPDELITRLAASDDFGKVSGILMPNDKTTAVRVRFARSEGGTRPSSVYADPYDGHVLGVPRAEDFFATVRKLHRWLLLPGDSKGYGRTITGIVALGLLVLVISGLVLRWPRRAGRWKVWLKPSLSLPGRGWQKSLHEVVGTWVLPIYLVIALTGLTYSYPSYRDGWVWLLSRPETLEAKQPKAPRTAKSDAKEAKADVKPAKEQDAKADAKPALGFDKAWATLLHAQGGRFTMVQMLLPPNGTVMRVRSWPQDSSMDTARDEFRIDAATGRLVSADIYADKTIGEKAIASILDIHRGAVLGWPGKLLFMLAAATMPLFLVTGLLLYLSRRRHKRMMRRPAIGSLVPGE